MSNHTDAAAFKLRIAEAAADHTASTGTAVVALVSAVKDLHLAIEWLERKVER